MTAHHDPRILITFLSLFSRNEENCFLESTLTDSSFRLAERSLTIRKTSVVFNIGSAKNVFISVHDEKETGWSVFNIFSNGFFDSAVFHSQAKTFESQQQ
jgi:hypothetical protein